MTSAAPGWVSYAALGLSGVAGTVALVSARISYLAYKAGGPRIRLLVVMAPGEPEPGRTALNLTVVNSGRGDVSIAGFHVTPYGSRKPVLEIEEVDIAPPLPYRLPGNSQQSWGMDVLPTMRRYDAALRKGSIKPWSSWPQQVFFTVRLGNGSYVHAKSTVVNSQSIIAAAFPD